MFKVIIISFLLLFIPCLAFAQSIERVVDGDTIVLKSGEKVRLYGVDCAEMNTNQGKMAKKYLEKILKPNTKIDVLRKGSDNYGRTLGIIVYNLESINFKLIEEKICKKYRWYKAN